MAESQEQQTAQLDQPDPQGPAHLAEPVPVEREGIPRSSQLPASVNVPNPAGNFEVKSLTLGEIADIEDLSGQPIGALADDAVPKGKALAALAYIIKRRSDAGFTYMHALRLSLDEVGELTKDMQGDDDPKD